MTNKSNEPSSYDEPYTFDQPPTASVPFPFTPIQFARLLLFRFRLQDNATTTVLERATLKKESPHEADPLK